MERGQEVKVYHDPATCESLEGVAWLLTKQQVTGWKQEYWTVQFIKDGFVCDRFINTEKH